LIKNDLFKSHPGTDFNTYLELSREEAIAAVIAEIEENGAIVATTGMASRELFELRAKKDGNHSRDFLTVGGMGHAGQIALGLALSRPALRVYCLDGDGSAIMHMGGLGIVGEWRAPNLTHIILNNGAHDSVGGQPTVGFGIDFCAIARACKYAQATKARTADQVKTAVGEARKSLGPHLIEIQIRRGSRKDLGRPTTSPLVNKTNFMDFLQK